MNIYLNTTQTLLISQCHIANSYFLRLKGLLGRKNLLRTEGIYFPKCNSIHMFFMQFPIDVLFLDENQLVVFMRKNIRPWQIQLPVSQAKNTLEISAGLIDEFKITIGDKLIIGS